MVRLKPVIPRPRAANMEASNGPGQEPFHPFLVLALACPAIAGDLELAKAAGEYQVFHPDRQDSPVIGNNEIRIEIESAVGGPRSQTAEVLINCCMPAPCPG